MWTRAFTLIIVSALVLGSSNAAPATDTTRRDSLRRPLKMLWVDNEADPLALASREKVSVLLDKAKNAGFNVIVPDTRNWHGLAFYKSKIAPRPTPSYPQDFDFLATVTDEAHKRGMLVHAGLNVFVEGAKDPTTRIGAAWDHPEWQAVVYDRLVKVAAGDGLTTFARGVDQRATSGVSVLTPHYGKRYPREDVGRTTAPKTVRPGFVATVADSCVTTVVREAELTTAGIDIPANGYVLLLADATSSPPLQVGQSVTIAAETVMLPEAEYPGGMLLYTNPAHPDVQKRNLEIIAEVLSDYDIDGVILDRVRFDSFKVDFSDLSRTLFEKATGKPVAKWPEDICVPANPLTGEPMAPGARFDDWVAWRASVIRSFMEKARETVDRHEKKHLGDYVGAWYDTYWEVGANWADASFDPNRADAWTGTGIDLKLPAGYAKAGYAQMLDYLSPGVYYSAVRRDEAPVPGKSIEGALDVVQRVTGGHLPLVPGIYVPNLKTDELHEAAIRMCIEKTGGVMVFSQTSIEKANRWEATARGLEATPQLPE